MSELKELERFKTQGKPVYVPGLEKDSRLLKGWEIGDEFMENPEYVAPPPPPRETIEPIKKMCVKCGQEASKKGVIVQGGMPHTVNLCDKCTNYG